MYTFVNVILDSERTAFWVASVKHYHYLTLVVNSNMKASSRFSLTQGRIHSLPLSSNPLPARQPTTPTPQQPPHLREPSKPPL